MHGLSVIGVCMGKFIATRELLYSDKSDSDRRKFVVRVSSPYPIAEGTVNFEFHPGASVCEIEIDGLPEKFVEKVYGIDSVHALSLAINIDPYLKGLKKRYDLYWLSGEPYFEG